MTQKRNLMNGFKLIMHINKVLNCVSDIPPQIVAEGIPENEGANYLTINFGVLMAVKYIVFVSGRSEELL
jgi:hypothetical protein